MKYGTRRRADGLRLRGRRIPDATRWAALLDGAAQALGKTRAEIDAFLDAIPQEGGV